MRTDTANYSLDEAEMNRLGYYILNTLKAPRDAVQIFEMNVAGFPRSANTYDSLGEAYSRRPTPRRQSRLPEVGQPESAELECDPRCSSDCTRLPEIELLYQPVGILERLSLNVATSVNQSLIRKRHRGDKKLTLRAVDRHRFLRCSALDISVR